MKRATSATLPLMAGMAAMCWHSISAAETIDGPRVHWNFAYWGKPRAQSVLYEKFAEYVDERTGGKFTMQIHWGTLTQPRDNLDGIKLGAYEGTHFVGSYYPGKLPAANGIGLPFLPFTTYPQLAAVYDDYFAHPQLVEELGRWGGLYYMGAIIAQYEVIGRGTPPSGLEGWKGQRIRAPGPVGQIKRAVGAVPTSVPSPEVYTSMDRGLVDSVAFPYYALSAYTIHEIGDWFTHGLKLATSTSGFMIRTEAYEELPDQYKAVMEEYRTSVGYPAAAAAYEESDAASLQTFRDAGLHEVAYNAEERQAFAVETARPVWDEWVEKVTDLGYDGAALLELLLESGERHEEASF